MRVWKWVVGWEGQYEVSNDGLVRSFERTVIHSDNRIRVFPSKNLKRQLNSKTGYIVVQLNAGTKRKMAYVHRLVAIAFIPNPENKRCVNHKDGIRHRNHKKNLEWATHSENSLHAHAMGLAKALRGEDAWNAKITWQSAEKLRGDVWSVIESWCAEHGVGTQAAWEVISKRNWVKPGRKQAA